MGYIKDTLANLPGWATEDYKQFVASIECEDINPLAFGIICGRHDSRLAEKEEMVKGLYKPSAGELSIQTAINIRRKRIERDRIVKKINDSGNESLIRLLNMP